MPYKNPEDKKAFDKRWAMNNITQKLETNARYLRSVKGRYARLKVKAKQRGLIVHLTREEYGELVKDPCYYCGKDLPELGHGIDRKDSKDDYNVDNCVPCCSECNRMKSDVLTYEEMLVAIAAVINFRGN